MSENVSEGQTEDRPGVLGTETDNNLHTFLYAWTDTSLHNKIIYIHRVLNLDPN